MMASPVNDDIPDKEEVKLEDTACSTNKQTMVCWNNFDTFFNKDGKKRARCKRCREDYAIGSSSHGTENLNAHPNNCWPKPRDMSLCGRKFDQEIYRAKVATAILMHNLPFKIVESDSFRNLVSSLNSDVKAYSKDIARVDCIKIYKKEKKLLRDVLVGVEGRLSLTFDLWTSLATDEYICLTAHYVDTDWVLRSKILDFCLIPPPIDAPLLSEKVYELLKEWGIEKKVFSLTLDNTRVCDGMRDILKRQLQNDLLCEGEFFHVICSTDILNHIVEDGMKVITSVLHKVRESVKYIKGSDAHMLRFAQCCEQFELKQTYLRLDVCDMWNYAYLMLVCALKFRHVFVHYATVEPYYDHCPTTEEWDRALDICRLLEPLYGIAKLFSRTEYPTPNLFCEIVWIIQIRLTKASESEDVVVRELAQQLLPKFEKYWDSYSSALSMAIVLDPRYKMDFLKFCYNKIDANTCHEKLMKVKDAMESLFLAYVSQSSLHDSTQTSNAESIGDSEIFLPKDEILEFDNYDDFGIIKSELDSYLEEPRLSRKDNPQMDVLKFWRGNHYRYPVLSTMARDIMSIPVTTVASESTFNIGGKMLTKLRDSLSLGSAQLRVCGYSWLNGYFDQSDDDRLKNNFWCIYPCRIPKSLRIYCRDC